MARIEPSRQGGMNERSFVLGEPNFWPKNEDKGQTTLKKFFQVVSKDEEQEKSKAILGNDSGSDSKEDLKEHEKENGGVCSNGVWLGKGHNKPSRRRENTARTQEWDSKMAANQC